MGEWATATVTSGTLTGASVSFPIIPANCWVIGVQVDVLTTITGATSFSVGDSLNPGRWGSGLSTILGTFNRIRDIAPTTIPHYGSTIANVILTASGGNFTGGTVRIRVFYTTLNLGLYGNPWLQDTVLFTNMIGSFVTAPNFILGRCWVIGISAEVEQAITGATSFQVGDNTGVERWGTNIPVAFGTKTDISDFSVTAIPGYGTASDVRVTALGVPFTGGSVRLRLYYAPLTLGWRNTVATLTGISGPTAAMEFLIPSDVHMIGVRIEVMAAVTGATSFHVGDGTDATRWGANISPDLSTQTHLEHFQVTTIPNYGQDPKVVLTAVGGNFTGGDVKITAYWAAWTEADLVGVDITIPAGPGDNVTVGEQLTIVMTILESIPLSVEDGVTVGEVSTVRVLLQPKPSDGLTLGDDPTVRIPFLERSVTDDLVLNEISLVLRTAVNALTIFASDGAVAADAPPSVSIPFLPPRPTDGILLGEPVVFVTISAMKISITEPVQMSETVPRLDMLLPVSVTQNVGTGEETTVRELLLPVSAGENIVVGENVIAAGPSTIIGAVMIVMGVKSGILVS